MSNDSPGLTHEFYPAAPDEDEVEVAVEVVPQTPNASACTVCDEREDRENRSSGGSYKKRNGRLIAG